MISKAAINRVVNSGGRVETPARKGRENKFDLCRGLTRHERGDNPDLDVNDIKDMTIFQEINV